MWDVFVLGVLFTIILLYVPGGVILAPVRLSLSQTISCAPLISSALYSICAIAFAYLGFATSWVGILLPSCLVAALISISYFVVLKIRGSKPRDWKADIEHVFSVDRRGLVLLLLYIGLAVIVTVIVFVCSLDTAGSISQDYDNYSHLNSVRDLVENGFFYNINRESYPQGWHCLATLCASALGGQVPIAINAVNFVLLAAVLPSGVYALLSSIFPDDRKTLSAGALCSIAFAAFPWGLITFGPLYPNFAAHIMLPAAAALFLSIFERGAYSSVRMWRGSCFVLGFVSVVLLHQSAAFTGAVLLGPFCCSLIWHFDFGSRFGARKRAAVNMAMVIAFVMCALLVWLALFRLPSLYGIVTFGWAPFQSVGQAIASVMTISFTKGSVVQPVLALSVLLGIFYCIASRRNLWLIVSYLLSSVIYVLCTAGEGVWQHLASGFWYNDSYRISAVLALACIPLAAVGMGALYKAYLKVASYCGAQLTDCSWASNSLKALFFALLIVGIYLPCVTTDARHGITTAFGLVKQDNSRLNSLAPDTNLYDTNEIAFVERVRDAVPDDAVILNLPYDGSIFSYGMNDLDVYFHSSWLDLPWDINADGGPESIVRSRLVDIATDPEVRNAVDEIGAEYVLLLDQGIESNLRELDEDPNEVGLQLGVGIEWPRSIYVNTYTPEWWEGITSITDSTPGFEVVLSEGDMRLYRIVG